MVLFDISIGGALLAGLLSFLSPCILPMVPFYLSYLAGVSINEMSSSQRLERGVRLRAVLAATLFALGVITIFVGLGAVATTFGQFVREYFDVLRWIAAAIIIAMGLHFLGVLRIGFLNRQFQVATGRSTAVSLGGAYVIGLAFAFGWTPCVGPILSAILATAMVSGSAMKGAWLLFVYGLGMTAPFILAAFFVGPFMVFMARFRRHLPVIEKLMGLLLIGFGVLIATNSMNAIGELMLRYVPWFTTIG